MTLGTQDLYSRYRLKADEDITSIKIGSFTKLTCNPPRLVALAATIIEGYRHKKEPQARYTLGVGRSLLPHLGF